MYILLVITTGLVAFGAMIIAYRRSRDSFHPLVYIAPMLVAMYVVLPLKLIYDDELLSFLTYDRALFVQTVCLLCVAAFCAGCLIATGNQRTIVASKAAATTIQFSASARARIGSAALLLGFVGTAAYLLGIYNVGGFYAAYGQAYGGGWSDYGYARDAVSLCIPAMILTLVVRANQPMNRKRLGQYVILIALFSLPYLLQGLLGARRGPTFLVIVAIGMSWYIMHRRRPPVTALALVSIIIGGLLLFLVTNRGNIYIGSDAETSTDVLGYFRAERGNFVVANEYLYGAGAMIYASETDNIYYGRRYFAVIFIRPIPRQLWQNKYEDVGVKGLEQNLGVGDEAFAQTLGWIGAPGAAPGIVADMWIEFSWGALGALFLIGWCYGRTWRLMISGNIFGTVMYVLLASLTLYLVFQTLEAMLVRFLFAAIPTYIVLRWAVGRTQARSTRRAFITHTQPVSMPHTTEVRQ
ncbi:MAG: hypothetical protein MSG64_01940 [Pyrinomonadaceae bacterium MAG19_C2-C3]|nr:hypothetical protein [Pyrinomonadaceae bacterium MAG19_C2-C3]